jgi:nicotinamide N-methyltransferase
VRPAPDRRTRADSWNAARAAATFLDGAPTLYRGRRVLELGAGAGLPGLVCALNGAAQVVLTDYPDPDLVANLQHNVAANVPADAAPRVSVAGYVWGRALPPGQDVFDLLILSDLVFNHSEVAPRARTLLPATR